MAMKMKISLAQTHLEFADTRANLEKAVHFVSRSAAWKAS